jgi:uncharacterized protein YkwD
MRNNPPTTHRLRSVSLALAASALFWLPAVGWTQTPVKPIIVTDSQATPAKPDPIPEQLVEAHNKERAKEKLPPLTLEPRLTEAALEHAKDMAEHGFMGHEGSDESTPQQRVANAGYRYVRTGENVAAGYKDVAEVMLAWMESPGHRHNVMGDYSEIGLARELGKDGKPYWCANFGTPMPKFDPATAAKDLIKRLNVEREAAKLPALVEDPPLSKAAQDQAVTMAKNKSEGTAEGRFDDIDPKIYHDIAMSTASGQPNAQSVVKALLARDELKKQILGKYSKVGTGYATAEDGVPYWCLILTTPPETVRTKTVKRKVQR